MLNQFKALFHRYLPGGHAETGKPLLDEVALQQIHAQALETPGAQKELRYEVNTMLSGERSSVYAGSGYEFADNTLYLPGDDSRFINWRILARSGKLYRKVFHEERRPQLWIVMDRRSGMRFGSKSQLKVSQAARLAVYQLYQSQRHQLACAGLLLDEQPAWFPPVQGSDRLRALIDAIVAPAPPLFNEQPYDLSSMLQELTPRLSPGSIVIIISDFHDFDEKHLPVYHALASRHNVSAIQVLDPMELNLPLNGNIHLAKSALDEGVVVDCHDAFQRARFSNNMKTRQARLEEALKKSGIDYRLVMTDQ